MQMVSEPPIAETKVKLSTTVAGWKSHGVPDDDPRVVQARAELAYLRVRTAIAAEAGLLSAHSVDRLVRDLMSMEVAP